MPATFTITTTGLPKLRKADIRAAKKAAMWDVANQWHIQFKDLHFTPRGARRYRYAPRLTKFITQGLVRFKKGPKGRRVPMAPSGDPLVWSGRSKVLSVAKMIIAKSTWSRVTSPIRSFNRPTIGNPRMPPGTMVKEYRRIVPAEWRVLNKVASNSVARELKISKRRVVVRIQ